MEVTRALLRLVEADIDDALAEVAQKHGLTSLTCKGATFSHENFTLKVEGVVAGGLDISAQRYEQVRELYHLPDLNSVFHASGLAYKIVGLTGGEMVIGKQLKNGKLYRFRKEVVQPVQVRSFNQLLPKKLTPAEQKRQDDADAKRERDWEAKVS